MVGKSKQANNTTSTIYGIKTNYSQTNLAYRRRGDALIFSLETYFLQCHNFTGDPVLGLVDYTICTLPNLFHLLIPLHDDWLGGGSYLLLKFIFYFLSPFKPALRREKVFLSSHRRQKVVKTMEENGTTAKRWSPKRFKSQLTMRSNISI